MKIQENINLSRYTTFRIGGIAKYFVEVKTKEELREAILFAKKNNISFFVLGGGSNVLISDKNFEGVIIKLINNYIKVEEEIVTSGAGTIWDDLVKFSVNKNLQGIECLSGIPGSVGAAPVQNIGAYGQELKECLYELTAYDLNSNQFINLKREDCKFGYRDSIFKNPKFKNRYIIFEVKFKLNKNEKPNLSYQSLIDYLQENNITNPSLEEVRESVIKIRENKLPSPNKIGSAGSFFKNPILTKDEKDNLINKYKDMPFFEFNNDFKIPAGWLIDQTGWKGKKYKHAGVFKNNALVLTNEKGDASATEIVELANKIKESVYENFGIKLEVEVQLVNFR